MKQPMSHSFFSPDEKDKIARTVNSAENGTSGEIATMVIDQSDHYYEAEILGGILVSGLISIIIAVTFHIVSIWTFIPSVVLFYLPTRLLFVRFPGLKLPFINKARMAHAVRERAVRAFYEKGLYKTRDENGILIFISILERKVWILGDRGVDRKIPHERWQEYAKELSEGIRAGNASESLCKVITKCGLLLAEHFPRKADDSNELSDEVIS